MLMLGGLFGKFDCWLRTSGIWFNGAARNDILDNGLLYSGRGKFMPLPLKSKILETPGSLVTDDSRMFPL